MSNYKKQTFDRHYSEVEGHSQDEYDNQQHLIIWQYNNFQLFIKKV